MLDDASTDESSRVLNSYKGQIDQLIFNTENSGSPFKQWKKGINLANGSWIWIAESDDWCEPDFLEKLVDRIKDGIGLVYAQTYDMKDGKAIVDRLDTTKHFDPNIWETDFDMNGLEFISKYLVEKNYIPNASAVIFKKSLVGDSLDSELVNMKMCGDWLFWIRLLSKTGVSFLAMHLNYFRFHSTASRVHSSLERKKARVLEEEPIRRELKMLGVKQEKYFALMQEKWFDYHAFAERYSPEFKALNRSGLFPGLVRKFTLHKFLKKVRK